MALRAQLNVSLTDGTVITASTGADWAVTNGPIVYNDFDIILGHFLRISQRRPTPHACMHPRAHFCLVPTDTLLACRLLLGI